MPFPDQLSKFVNAKFEFLRHVKEVGQKVLAVEIRCSYCLYKLPYTYDGDEYVDKYDDDDSRDEEFFQLGYKRVAKTIFLYKNYTEQEYNEFLKQLDFLYDDGYGTQYLFGTIWYDDDSWSERHEYDGSECWEYKSPSPIPTRPYYKILKMKQDLTFLCNEILPIYLFAEIFEKEYKNFYELYNILKN